MLPEEGELLEAFGGVAEEFGLLGTMVTWWAVAYSMARVKRP